MDLHHPPADDFGAGGDDGVSESSEAVHPSGYPMSHSTHVGFRGPVPPSSQIASRKFTVWPCSFLTCGFEEPPSTSDVDGVGHRTTARRGGWWRRMSAGVPLAASVAFGVGHVRRFTTPASLPFAAALA